MDHMDMGPSQRDMPSISHMNMELWSGGWSPESPLILPIIGCAVLRPAASAELDDCRWTSTSLGSFLFLLWVSSSSIRPTPACSLWFQAVFLFGLLSEAASELVAADQERSAAEWLPLAWLNKSCSSGCDVSRRLIVTACWVHQMYSTCSVITSSVLQRRRRRRMRMPGLQKRAQTRS